MTAAPLIHYCFFVFLFVNLPLWHLPPRFHVALISIILFNDLLSTIVEDGEMEKEWSVGQTGTRVLRWWVFKAITWCGARRSNLTPNSVYLGRVFHVFFTIHGMTSFAVWSWVRVWIVLTRTHKIRQFLVRKPKFVSPSSTPVMINGYTFNYTDVFELKQEKLL